VEVVDLSANVVRHHAYFNDANGRVLENPKVSVYVNDGRQHLRMQPPGTYDIITAEPPPLTEAGIASLYSTEFYRLARSRLSEGGFLSQWLPAYQVSENSVRSLIRSFVDVFPASVMLHGGGKELILMGVNGDSIVLELGKAWRRIVSNPRLARDLHGIGVGSPVDLVGVFAGGALALQSATRSVRPVTDDRPIIEYDSRSHLTETRLPSDIFAVSQVASWCPRCFRDGQLIPAMRDLAPLLRQMAALYRSERFLQFSNVR
jgi:spermidine synthase